MKLFEELIWNCFTNFTIILGVTDNNKRHSGTPGRVR